MILLVLPWIVHEHHAQNYPPDRLVPVGRAAQTYPVPICTGLHHKQIATLFSTTAYGNLGQIASLKARSERKHRIDHIRQTAR